MTAVARTALAQTPAREDIPKLRGEDEPAREFSQELADKQQQQAPQVPTAEQLALAGVIVAPLVRPVPPIEMAPQGAIAQLEPAQATAPLLAPNATIDAKLDAPTEVPSAARDREEPSTPLEQAVLDLLDRQDAPIDFIVAKVEVARDVPAPRIAQAAPVAEPRTIPQPDAPTSHVNLVLDDGDRRLVVTVAVRGNDVNVQLRGGDDIAAGLARNAATLDEAMRMRGLSLAEFTASRDHEHHERERPEHERRETSRERFTLEETP